MKPYLVLIFVAIFSFLSFSCKETMNNIIETEVEPEPGSRNYAWTSDTIKDRAWFNKFVGESIDDIWAVNMDGGSLDCLYKYNGNNWLQYRTVPSQVPTYNLMSGYLVNRKLWLVSSEGNIWKYEKEIMTKEAMLTYDSDRLVIFEIDGKSENEIYAVGSRIKQYSQDGCILYYDGNKWAQKTLLIGYGGFEIIKYCAKNGFYFILGDSSYSTGSTNKLYKYDGKILDNIYTVDKGNLRSIHTIDGYLFTTLGNSVYRYYKGKLELFFTDNDPEFGGMIFGRSKNDIFVRMQHGVKHWNGTDLKYILKLPTNVRLQNKMHILKDDVFVDTKDLNTNYNIIYHGKLK